MAETFALARTSDGPADLWCAPTDEPQSFSVLNGAWTGRLVAGGVMLPDGETIPAVEVWRGHVPREYATDYNAAMLWIDAQRT
jgi:hypothetical protein